MSCKSYREYSTKLPELCQTRNVVPDHYKGLDPRARTVENYLGLNPGQASAFDLRGNQVKTLYNGAIHNWDISLP
jgi:hypothetical protein